jgi:hypothetical protein
LWDYCWNVVAVKAVADWKMKGIRYRLSALLLFTSALVAFFGFSQWRKNRIVEKSAYFKQYGVRIVMPDSAIDSLWQRNPTKALIGVPPDSYTFNYHRLQEELGDFGIVNLVYGAPEHESEKPIAYPKIEFKR